MKQDYNLMKSILETMEDCEKPYIESYELAEKLGLLNRNTMQVLDNSKLDDFIGHIYLLGDNRCIDQQPKTMVGNITFTLVIIWEQMLVIV